jgi:lipoyl synthase
VVSFSQLSQGTERIFTGRFSVGIFSQLSQGTERIFTGRSSVGIFSLVRSMALGSLLLLGLLPCLCALHLSMHQHSSAQDVPRVGAAMPSSRPDWFRVPAPGGIHTNFQQMKDTVKELNLHTVCEEAQCPNIGECWNGGTGTIMLLGDTCTRGCRFCAVKTDSSPPPPDPFEPFQTAQALSRWQVNYVVLTSVDRDDLEDGGAGHFATTVQLIKSMRPSLLVECLVSDFAGNETSVMTLACSGLDVYAHNVETVERLQRHVRDHRASYRQSLDVLRLAKQHNPRLYTKSSLMLGLGERREEVLQSLRDLRAADVDVVTLGQYLRPTSHHLSVVEYISPSVFEDYKEQALSMGFKYVASGPLVRSSYRAGEFFLEHLLRSRGDSDSTSSSLADGSGSINHT